MAASLQDLLTSMQQGVQAMNNLIIKFGTVFPQVSATSTSATTGGISYNSSQPALFLTVVTSSGGTYKTPLFNP